MAEPTEPVAGFSAPMHRSLSDPILLGGAPRTVAIANGTLAAAIALGLRLWIPGVNRLANLIPHRRPILPPLRGELCW